MNLLDIILLAIALAMDCFAVSIVSGVIVRARTAAHDDRHASPILHTRLRMAFLFGFFQALMPLIGWLGISWFSRQLEAYDHWIAFVLLAFIGGNMIREAFSPEEEQHFNPHRLRTQLLLAVATSIDALAVGVSFACMGYRHLSQLMVPLPIIALVSFLFSLLGTRLGLRFGGPLARRLKPGILGGIILILIGVKILVSHLWGVG